MTLSKLMSKVENVEGCWNWSGATDGRFGYGQIRLGEKRAKAHRVSWELHNGPMPKGMMVLHRCDNPLCVNPDHLFIGTQADNMSDKVIKGRQLKGEAHHKHKLTTHQVIDIRWLLIKGVSRRDLSESYGVSVTTINRIKSGKIWKHIQT